MTIRLVYSGGDNIGSSTDFDQARTTIDAAITDASDGDKIYIAHDHNEADYSAGDKEFSFGQSTIKTKMEIRIMHRETDGSIGAYDPKISTEDQTFKVDGTGNYLGFFGGVKVFGAFWYGYQFFYTVGESDYYQEDGVIETAQTTGGLYIGAGNSDNRLHFRNVHFKGGASSRVYIAAELGQCLFEGGKVTGDSHSSGWLYPEGNRMATVRLDGFDFSGMTRSNPPLVLVPTDQGDLNVEMVSCVFPAGYSLTSGTFGCDGQSVTAISSGVSTDDPLYNMHRETLRGTVIEETTVVRSAGGYTESAESDAKVSMSLEADSTECTPDTPVEGFRIPGYCDATGSKTFKVQCAHDFETAPTDEEVWMELHYMATAGSPVMTVASTKVFSYESPASIPSNSESWDNDTGYTTFDLSLTVSVGRVGRVWAVIFNGRYEDAGERVLYDMKLDIT